MFLVDTNVWLAHTFSKHPHHQAAISAILDATNHEPAVICRATEQSLLRLITTPAVLKLYSVALTNDEALGILDGLLAEPSVAFRDEPDGIATRWHQLARRRTSSPKVWMDAYLAAFAILAGLTLITLDADFKQYEVAGLKLQVLPRS